MKKMDVLQQRRLSAQITVFTSLIFMLMISLVTACIHSALVAVVYTKADAVRTLSGEAVMAGYENKMLEEYDVFVLKDTEILNNKLNDYVQKNTNGMQEHIHFLQSEISEKAKATDANGKYLVDEIIAYMDDAIYSELYQEMKDTDKASKQAKAVTEVTDQIVHCQEKSVEKNKHLLRALMWTEGIETTDSGFVIRRNMPVYHGRTFAKGLLAGEITMQEAAVDEEKVFTAVNNAEGYTSATQSLNILQEALEQIEVLCEEEEENQEEIEDWVEAYNAESGYLAQNLEAACEGYEKAIQALEAYENTQVEMQQEYVSCKELLERNKENMQDDVYDRFDKDINEMQTEQKAVSFCDEEVLYTALIRNYNQVLTMKELAQEIDTQEVAAQQESLLDCIQTLEYELGQYDLSDIRFSYADVSFEQDGEGIGAIRQLYQKLKDGVVGIVIGDKQISEKTIRGNEQFAHLANEHHVSGGQDVLGGMAMLKKQGLYHEYVMTHFPDYSEYQQEDGSIRTDTGKALDYMVEYIIAGEPSDRENLGDIVTKLSILREGTNLTHLIMDASKRGQAYDLAVTLVGFTGNLAVIKAAQYTIMAAWAYAESLMDIKELLAGGNVELIKQSADWHLSLDSMLKMDWLEDKAEFRKDKKGLDYSGYLRLLLLQQSGRKYYNMMAAMEIRMEELGLKAFRMRDYLCGMKAKMNFFVEGSRQTYETTFEYMY